MKKDIYSKQTLKQFYEDRFSTGYMDDWDTYKKDRVLEIIQGLPLKKRGKALDFGCGNGVFTEVLKKALPQWDIFGCDISEIAINNAKKRFSDCTFFLLDNNGDPNAQAAEFEFEFDFVFSHHVLEHVLNIQETLADINHFLKPNASLLFIFPCGNKDSLEYRVAQSRIDGINTKLENRFFYEDPGHVRRLTSVQIEELMRHLDFKLHLAYYSNQYYGAIKWITRSSPKFIIRFTNPSKAKNNEFKRILSTLRIKLLFINFIQLPTTIFYRINNKRKKKIKDYGILILDFVPSFLTYPFYALIDWKSSQEWKKRKTSENGSEMYLFFKRG